MLTFAPEDTLVALCVHGAKHLWYKLQWLCDIGELLCTHDRLDWERVMLQAQGSKRMLFLGLYLVQHVLGVTLPEEICRMVSKDSFLPILTSQVEEQWFQDAPAVPGVFRLTWFRLQTLETLRNRGYFLCDTLFTPTPAEWEQVALPDILSPGYYVLRLLYLSSRHLWLPLTRLLKNN